MATTIAAERKRLTATEFEAVAGTHHPAIGQASREELIALARRLRAFRDKAGDQAGARRRERRGKAEARGATAAPPENGLALKQQLFAAALKRLNRQLARLEDLANRARNRMALEAALARKRNARVHHPGAGRSAGAGMAVRDNTKRSVRIDPREIGRVSQAVKVAQAKRDR